MEGQSLQLMASARHWRREDMKSRSLLPTLTGRETVPCQSEFRLIWKAFGSDIFLVRCPIETFEQRTSKISDPNAFQINRNTDWHGTVSRPVNALSPDMNLVPSARPAL